MESIVSTEPACSLDCGPAGNCYIEQSRGDDVDLVGDDDGDDVSDDASMAMDLEGNDVTPRRKQGSFRQRCQCPLGRGGDRCQLGEWYFSISTTRARTRLLHVLASTERSSVLPRLSFDATLDGAGKGGRERAPEVSRGIEGAPAALGREPVLSTLERGFTGSVTLEKSIDRRISHGGI